MTNRSLLPINIAAYRGNWQRYNARKRNKKFLAFAQKVFQRDDYRCRFCGFQTKKFLSAVNIDHDYNNNKIQNIASACSLCAQCFFVESSGLDGNSGGYIIHLPEISQADLNHFCRALFTSMTNDVPYKGKLQSCYLSLKDRGKVIEKLLGPDASQAVTFGQALLDSSASSKVLEHQLISSLRFLAEPSCFTKETAHWKETTFKNIPL